MNHDGVGCESCHGTRKSGWGFTPPSHAGIRFSPTDKQNDYGFMDTKNLVRRIELCAGCHVGQDARDGLPLRDVNHDLIAAGHPRLNFEFAAYQENQPKHWKTDDPSGEAAADFPVRAWALGQLVSARAALSSLGSRSARASATCGSVVATAVAAAPVGSCSLAGIRRIRLLLVPSQSGRRTLAEEPQAARRRSGVPPWGSWYYPIIGELVANSARF